MLVKLMEDPERIAGVAPELRRLLDKMVSGVSAADLSKEEDAQVSLGSLTAAERGDLSDLLKKDQGLPQPTRDALSGALRAKATVPAIALTPRCTGATKGAKCWREMSNRPVLYVGRPLPSRLYRHLVRQMLWRRRSWTGHADYSKPHRELCRNRDSI